MKQYAVSGTGSEFSNARISVKLHGDKQSNPMSLAIEEESEHSEHKGNGNQKYGTLMDPMTGDNLDL